MLQEIRDRAQGVIAWVIVVLISVPFALWGIQDYLGGGGDQVVADVDGSEITQQQLDTAVQNYRISLRRQLGANYRPDLINNEQMREDVLNRLIQQRLVNEQKQHLKLSVGDEAIKQQIRMIPAFQRNGKFDRQSFDQLLAQQGQTEATLVQSIRFELESKIVSNAVQATGFITDSAFDEQIRLRLQKRDLRYLTLPYSLFEDQQTITEEAVSDWYESHQQDYVEPEKVRLAYIELTPAAAGAAIEPFDEELRTLYEETKEQYVTKEQRRASHILLELKPDADEEQVAAVMQKAQSLLQQIKQGADFAEIAKQESADPGSAVQGGDLGFFEKGMMADEFDKVVFSLGKGQLSEPVRTSFGVHLIKLVDIRPSSGQTYEQALPKLREAYIEAESDRRFYDLAEEMANLVYEAQDNLESSARELGVEVQTSGWISRNQGEGIGEQAAVRAAAFSDDVLQQGNNSEIIELAADHLLAVRIIDHQDAQPRSLESVHDEVVEQLKQQAARKQALAAAQKLADEFAAGKSVDEYAAHDDYILKSPGYSTRTTAGIDRQILQTAFTMPKPKNDMPLFRAISLPSGDAVVVAVYGVQEGELSDLDKNSLQALREAASRTQAQDDYSDMLAQLKDQADIKISKPQP
ncbi:MAG: SurA N-terminal domain-containing protein [gamma proteobacterium symbiont of Bathyaustriella thionipta]|nr:SurA N-terminal domain-containing protein [gamma proteobacterium symbiont of Bathyaustriella thionipta]